ncbi:MAG: tRNA pseudouridine(55) synthase TruB [Clostridia bacterium]|nr:tRNA pseudouridine(55) synthase TruB [Clostridia bacterium]
MDGILIVKKEKGCTSHDVVAKVKRIAKTKVGHTGTLDPMATGVLPLLLGEGTKLSKYLIEHDKIYEAVVQLGKKTDTADSEGKVIEEKEVDSNLVITGKIQTMLKQLEVKQMQRPPIYSAIKIKGKKLYEYARKNEEIEIPEREIEIYNMQLIDLNEEEKTISFRVHCSKGTYIRSLCETIAEKLNTVGYMKELSRIKVGKFTIEQAISIKEIKTLESMKQEEKNPDINFLQENLITIEQFFRDKASIILNERQLTLFYNGVQQTRKEKDEIYRIYDEKNQFIGTGVIEKGLLKREIVIKNIKD